MERRETHEEREERKRKQRENSKYWLHGPFFLGLCRQCESVVYDNSGVSTAYVSRFADECSVVGTMEDGVIICDGCISPLARCLEGV